MAGGRWLVVGISGVTCGGKTTLASRLAQRYPGSVIICQDDYFLPETDPRHVLVPGLEHFNWDTLTALDMDRMCADVASALSGGRMALNDKQSPNSGDSATLQLLILEGFLVLNDERVRRVCDVMYYVTLERDVCWQRRQLRHYEPPDIPGYFDACVWPMHMKYLAELRLQAGGDVVFLDGEKVLECLENDVLEGVEALMKCEV